MCLECHLHNHYTPWVNKIIIVELVKHVCADRRWYARCIDVCRRWLVRSIHLTNHNEKWSCNIPCIPRKLNRSWSYNFTYVVKEWRSHISFDEWCSQFFKKKVDSYDHVDSFGYQRIVGNDRWTPWVHRPHYVGSCTTLVNKVLRRWSRVIPKIIWLRLLSNKGDSFIVWQIELSFFET